MRIRWLSICLAGVMVVGTLSSYAAAEAYYVVTVQDMSKESSTKVMSGTEFKELEKTIQQENQYFRQAVMVAAKEWSENAANKGYTFAGTRVSPRRIVGVPERFSTQAKAQEKLTALEALESKKADREAEREIARSKSRKVVKKTNEEIARENKREEESHEAIVLIQAKLTEIIAAKTATVGVGAGKTPAVKQPEAAAVEAGKKAL